MTLLLIPFLIKNGFNGILVSGNDSDSLADAVISIYRDKAQWNNIQYNATKFVRDFSPQIVCKEWERIYLGSLFQPAIN